MDLESFYMKKYIVYASNEAQAPEYMRAGNSLMTIRNVKKQNIEFSPVIQGDWPTAEDLGLDQSQFNAFYAGLTKDFSIIQGPPGTGKAYLGNFKFKKINNSMDQNVLFLNFTM